MNTPTLGLFGGALLSAGLASPTLADLTINDELAMQQTYDSASEWHFGLLDIHTIDFSVESDGQVQIDVLSYDFFTSYFDSVLMLFTDDGNPLSTSNRIANNDDRALGTDLNGSVNSYDSFIDEFLTAGEYTIAIGAFTFTPAQAEAGIAPGDLFSNNGITPLTGLYQIDIYGDVTQSSPCPADLTGDGQLDFFDVSAFLTAFGAQDPIADFTADGAFDFFDVSAFLAAFGAGCP